MTSKKRTIAFVLLCVVTLFGTLYAWPDLTAEAKANQEAQEQLQATLMASNRDLAQQIAATNKTLADTNKALQTSNKDVKQLKQEVKALTQKVGTLEKNLSTSQKKLNNVQSTFEDLGVNFP